MQKGLLGKSSGGPFFGVVVDLSFRTPAAGIHTRSPLAAKSSTAQARMTICIRSVRLHVVRRRRLNRAGHNTSETQIASA